MDRRGFIFTGTAFLLVVPAIMLAISFTEMMKMGDKATTTTMTADNVYYIWKSIQLDFEEICSNAVNVHGDNNDTIEDMLKNEWAPSIENGSVDKFGVNISIDEEKIEVLRVNYSGGNIYIQIGNVDNINDSIPVRVSDLDGNIIFNSTPDNGLGPYLILVGAGGATSGDTDPPGAVVPSSPPCQFTPKIDPNPTLTWDAASDPSGISYYYIEVDDRNNNFNNIIEQAYVASPTTSYTTTNASSSNKKYYWRVFANDSAGNWNYPSDYNTCYFRTKK